MALFAGWAALAARLDNQPGPGHQNSHPIWLWSALVLIVLIDAANRLDHAQRLSFGLAGWAGTIIGLTVIGLFIALSGALSDWLGTSALTGHELDSSIGRASDHCDACLAGGP